MPARGRLTAALAAPTLAGVAALGALAGAPALAASCPASPTPSPTRFSGVVTLVKDAGTLASVRLDDGRMVLVRGTGGPDPDDDRTYVEGARYEFHPRNAASPYLDDACTATRLLAEPSERAEQRGQRRLLTQLAIAAVLVALLLAAPSIARRIRALMR